jgi:hypothetical protein
VARPGFVPAAAPFEARGVDLENLPEVDGVTRPGEEAGAVDWVAELLRDGARLAAAPKGLNDAAPARAFMMGSRALSTVAHNAFSCDGMARRVPPS